MNMVVAEPVAAPSAPPIPDRLVVVVTHEDIREGARSHALSCAVARALKREYADATVRYHETHVWLNDATRLAYQTSPELANWLDRFDRGAPVAPERFVLERMAS